MDTDFSTNHQDLMKIAHESWNKLLEHLILQWKLPHYVPCDLSEVYYRLIKDSQDGKEA